MLSIIIEKEDFEDVHQINASNNVFSCIVYKCFDLGMQVTLIFYLFYLEGHITRKFTLKNKKKSMDKKLDTMNISMGFTYPISDRWCMCTISYSIPRWRTATSCGQCRSSNMIYYAEIKYDKLSLNPVTKAHSN
jgi:hypothetical protein